jgi:hypothetical protein
MAQTTKENPGQPATERAEELLDSMGRRLGLFAARAGQRIQGAATSVREEVGRIELPKPPSGDNSGQPVQARFEESSRVATEKAEVLVDRAAERLADFVSLATLQFLKASARVREEAEDMWAEAQHIRQQNARKPQ